MVILANGFRGRGVGLGFLVGTSGKSVPVAFKGEGGSEGPWLDGTAAAPDAAPVATAGADLVSVEED